MASRRGRRHPGFRAALAIAITLAIALAPGLLAGARAGAAGAAAPSAVTGHPAPAGLTRVAGVSCATTRDCWAVGTGPSGSPSSPGPVAAIAATTDGGAHWRSERVAAGTVSLSAISCANRRSCTAVGDADTEVGGQSQQVGTVLVTTDGGRRWHPDPTPPGAIDVTGVECKSPSRCMVLATDGTAFWSATTAGRGAVWQRGSDLPAGFAGPASPSCTTALHCVVAGYVPTAPGQGTGAVALTSDGGATWSAATLPQGIGLLHAVSCRTGGKCLAVGTTSTVDSAVQQGKATVLSSSDGGATWSVVPAPGAVDDAFGVACPGPSTCVVVGTLWKPPGPTPVGAVVTAVGQGGRWAVPRRRYVPQGLVALSCPSAQTCVAGGADVLAAIELPAHGPSRR